MKVLKRSLLLCIGSIVLCTALLAGTTFAWFTQSVSSSGNTITAGEYTTAEDIADVFAAGGSINVENPVALTPTEEQDPVLSPILTVTARVTMNFTEDGSLGIDPAACTESLPHLPLLISVNEGGELTINNGTFSAEAGNNGAYGINILGGTVVINGGYFYGAATAVQVTRGTLVINGGFFDIAPTYKARDDAVQNAKYIVNCIDAAYKDGSAQISITGGTFVNFDPSANPEGAGTSYVADGYTVKAKTQTNGDIWYTVTMNI